MENIYLKTKKLLTIAVFLIATHVSVAQNTWYVNNSYTAGVDIYCTAAGASGNNGTSPATPKATLSEVLALTALANGDIIYVDAGNYSDHTLSFNKGITVLGAGIDKTIFQRASGTTRFGTISVSDVKFKNLKILNYNQTSDGISLNISASSGNLTGILLEGVWIDKSQASAGDGAINIFSSSTQKITVDIKNSLITCSTNGNYGSAIYIEGNGHTINVDKCHIESNAKATAGGALTILGTDSTDANKTLVTVSKTTFKNNTANSGSSGGAIFVYGSQLNITQSCFNGNTTTGFGTAISGGRRSRIYVTNCNFENNTGGTAQIYSAQNLTLTSPTTSAGNTILEVKDSKFDESAGTPKAIYYRGGAAGDYCLVENTTFIGTSNHQLQSYSATYPFTIRKSGNPTRTGTFTVDNTDTPDVFVSPICGGSISGTCAGGFTISCALDIFPPVINATNQTLPTNPTCTFTVPTFTATDNCDATPTVTSVPAAGSSLAINTTTDVTITATDSSGNTSVVVVRITTPTACTPGCSIKTWTAGAWSPAGTPTTANEVVIDDTYNTTTHGNIECCKLTVNAGKNLTITGDMYALVVNEVINNGTFTIENNGSLVQQDNTKTNTGNVIYKRTAKARNSDYVYWSSPVASYALSGHVATGPKYIWNTTAANANGTQGAWDAAPATLGLAQGVIVRGNADFSDVTTTINDFKNIFTGVPNNGIITKQISRGNLQGSGTTTGNATITAIDDNHNLIGNPYASAISAKDFLTLNSANLTGALQIWTHGTLVGNNGQSFYQNFSNSYSTNDYVSYNLSGTTFSPGTDYNIGAGQGFFVAMVDGATASTVNVTFNNAMRRTTGNSSTSATPNFFRNSSSQNQASKFWIDLVANNGVSSRSLVAYVEGATNQKDNLHDAITKPQGNLLLYSKLGEDRLNIQGKGLPFVDEDQVPMGYFAPAAGNYTLALAFVEGTFSNGQTIYVKDNLLNTYHNLSQNPYLFITQAGENQNRFVIVYKTTLGNDNFITVDVSIYVNDVISIKSNETIESIQIFDVLGKEIKKYENLSTTSFQDDFNLSNGVYIVKLKTDKNNTISKKVLK